MLRSLYISHRLCSCLRVPQIPTIPLVPDITAMRCPTACVHTSVSHSTMDRDKIPNKSREIQEVVDTKIGRTSTSVPDIATEVIEADSWYPTEDSHSRIYDGVRYDQLPIIHIKACKNNTILNVTDHNGKTAGNSSGGIVGFRTAKKGTTVAAQAAGLDAAQKAQNVGFTTVRVCVGGIGPGRLAAIKGVHDGGITIISITDTTKYNPYKPRKPRRV